MWMEETDTIGYELGKSNGKYTRKIEILEIDKKLRTKYFAGTVAAVTPDDEKRLQKMHLGDALNLQADIKHRDISVRQANEILGKLK